MITLSDAEPDAVNHFSLCFQLVTAHFSWCTFGATTFFPDVPFSPVHATAPVNITANSNLHSAFLNIIIALSLRQLCPKLSARKQRELLGDSGDGEAAEANCGLTVKVKIPATEGWDFLLIVNIVSYYFIYFMSKLIFIKFVLFTIIIWVIHISDAKYAG